MLSRDGLDSTLVASLIFHCTHTHTHSQQPTLPHSKPWRASREARETSGVLAENFVLILSIKNIVCREERKPTRCNNIDDLLSIVDVDY